MYRKSGHLTVYHGPMFAGKSSRLRDELNRYVDLGFKVLYINSEKDERASIMSTHCSGGTLLSDKIAHAKYDSFPETATMESFDVIGIDEGQFFDNLVPFVLDLVDNHHKIVICVGLDGNVKREKFGSVIELTLHADKSEKLTAKCHYCLKENQTITDAPFTKNIGYMEGTVSIGGADKYVALCRHHWNGS